MREKQHKLENKCLTMKKKQKKDDKKIVLDYKD